MRIYAVILSAILSMERLVGYAVFEGDAQLSRAFKTKAEALSKAENAGLLSQTPDGTAALEDHLSIRSCSDDVTGSSTGDDLDVKEGASVDGNGVSAT
jgi:hypothetical protein